MKLAIMQPYFFPYIGYFQLISAVDLFIVYDNIKYTKKGWITRNRILQNGKDALFFPLSLKGDSDHLNICDRTLSVDFDRDKLLGRVHGAYRRAPHFVQTFPLVEAGYAVRGHESFPIFASIDYRDVRASWYRNRYQGILGHCYRSQFEESGQGACAKCERVGANTYVNSIGGTELYDKRILCGQGDRIGISPSCIISSIRNSAMVFVPWLSIIDVLMFNSLDAVRTHDSQKVTNWFNLNVCMEKIGQSVCAAAGKKGGARGLVSSRRRPPRWCSMISCGSTFPVARRLMRRDNM